MGLNDECGIVIYVEKTAALFFSFGARGRNHQISGSNLAVALPLLAALARRHWTILTPERPDGSGRLAAHLGRMYEQFATSILSPREAEIVRLVLKGHSSKAIARTLGNSPNTVKVHRKRIFSKLDITAQGELLGLFMAACSRAPVSFEGDPLDYCHP